MHLNAYLLFLSELRKLFVFISHKINALRIFFAFFGNDLISKNEEGYGMFKRFFSLSNPLGIAFTAAALILTFSPEARKGTRKMLVKGTAALLSVGDQMKGLTVGARKEIGHIVEEAKVEKEQMVLPDFSEMIKNSGDATKTKVNHIFDDMKVDGGQTAPSFAHAMEMGEEMMGDSQAKTPVPKKVTKSKMNKNMALNKQVPNVLSNKEYNSMLGKPPF
jgi:hypothetical protein